MLDESLHIRLGEAIPHVKDCLLAGLVPMLRGSPAIGKSAVIHGVAAELDYLVIDARFAGYDPTDINGFPDLDRERGVAKYFPLETFPLDDQEIPVNPATGRPYAGWLLFCDELNSAPPSVQAASYKLFLDRMVGQRKLHKDVHICAAGNLDTDQAITHEMSTALISRLINFVVLPDLKLWMQWAQGPGQIRSLVTSYLEWRGGEHFYTFDNNEPNQPYAAPRTWEFVNDLLNVWNGNPTGKLVPIAGCINLVAADFIAFAALRVHLPKKSDVLSNPETAQLPNAYDPGPLYALTGALGDWFEEAHADKLMTYINRMPADFQVVTMRNIIRRGGQKLMGQKDVSAWMQANCDAFMA